MTHAEQRIAERTEGTMLDPHALHALAMKAAEKNAGKDIAVRLARLPQQQVRGTSNGDELWTIIRNGRIVTVMLRRSSQPPTAGALHVDQVFFHA